MPELNMSEDSLRLMLKEAVGEALEERRELLHDIVAEVLEEYGLTDAIQQGRDTDLVDRKEIFARFLDAP
jgi:hypothetical protein